MTRRRSAQMILAGVALAIVFGFGDLSMANFLYGAINDGTGGFGSTASDIVMSPWPMIGSLILAAFGVYKLATASTT